MSSVVLGQPGKRPISWTEWRENRDALFGKAAGTHAMGNKNRCRMKLKVTQFRVLNYRNIDDSGWIPLERVTAFVGRNEAGKTALLKALHKFNPAIEEPFSAQREFPRDRFTADYRDGGDWPVCQVEFELSDEFRENLAEAVKQRGDTA